MRGERRVSPLGILRAMVLIFAGLALAQTASLQGAGAGAATTLYGNAPARHVEPWVRKTVIYQVWLNAYGLDHAFLPLDTHLQHIRELGATMIQLSPVNSHPPGSPYEVADYFGIDRSYGMAADLYKLIDDAHQLGLKIIMDVVFVHTSPTNLLLKEHPELYMHDSRGGVILSKWKLPRLDPNNPATEQYLIKNLLYWAQDFKVDGFRADVAAGLGVRFWDKAREQLDKSVPGLFLLAESTSPELMLHAFDATYGVSHMWTLFKILGYGAPASELQKNREADRAKFLEGTLILRALDNHDQRRAITQFGNEGALAGMVINLTMDGIPFIYNGQEIGDSNPTGVHVFFPINWKQERIASVDVQGIKFYRGSYEDQDWPIYKALVGLRATESSLTAGDLEWVANCGEDRIVSYIRKDAKQEILVIVNLSNRPWKGTLRLSPEEFDFKPLLSYDAVSGVLPNNRLTYSLGAFGYVVAKRLKASVRP